MPRYLPVLVLALACSSEADSAARDMHGNEGHYARALPHDRLVGLLKRYGRYAPRH